MRTRPAEQFQTTCTFPGLEEHAKSCHAKGCHICLFWKNRFQWSQRFSYEDETTKQKLPWIACSSSGQAVCLPCNESGVGVNKIARGQGRFHYGNLIRHAGSKSHQKAVRLAQNKRSAESGGAECFANPGAASALKTVTMTPSEQLGITAHEIAFLRVMVETRGSFRDFELWAAAAKPCGLASSPPPPSRARCKTVLQSMATFERQLTHQLMQAATSFRLQADGQGRIYQVEMGMVIWKLPRPFSWLLQPGQESPWLVQLGGRGPWLAERVICMREVPGELDTAGKVDMVAQCVLRACSQTSGAVDVELHKRVSANIRAWASDGADRGVGDAATQNYAGMVFREWEESHSAAKLLEHAVKNHDEARLVDGLLISGVENAPQITPGKRPMSLGKFLTTSEVFKNKCNAAQRHAGIALCANFGYAPQRYVSRARPMSREQRRWGPIWDALAEEAHGSSSRAPLARYFLRELGGENSHRLLFGGMLTDIAVEHYEWVAGGDKGHPDPTTAVDGEELFLKRLTVLIDEGSVVTTAETYTGAVLEFLKRGKTIQYGNRAQSCGLGSDG